MVLREGHPDRFIIFARGWEKVSGTSEIYVYAVSMDSNSVPHIQPRGTLWSFMNMTPPFLSNRCDFSVLEGNSAGAIYITLVLRNTTSFPGLTVYHVNTYKIVETTTAFTGSIMSSGDLSRVNTVPPTDPDPLIDTFLQDAATERIGILFSGTVINPNNIPAGEKKIVLNGFCDNVTPVTSFVAVLTGDAAPVGTMQFNELFSPTDLYYIGPSTPSTDIHQVLVHFKKDDSIGTDIGNDYQEFSALCSVDVLPGNNVMEQRSDLQFLKPQSNMVRYTLGDGPHSKKYLLFAASKKKNKTNLATDNFGTQFLMAFETNDDGNMVLPGHAIAKMIPGKTFCSSDGQREPRNPSRAEIVDDKFSYTSMKYPSLDIKSVSSFDIDLNPNVDAEEFEDCLYTSGGFLKTFNGEEYVENNFHFGPDIIGVSEDPVDPWPVAIYPFAWNYLTPRDPLVTKAAGVTITRYRDSAVSTADHPQYQFVFTYEWTDKNGNLHVSAPSEVLQLQGDDATFKIDVDHKVDFYLSPLLDDLTEKNNVVMKAFRTLNITSDSTDAGAGVEGEFFYDGVVDASAYEKDEQSDLYGLLKYQFKNSDAKLVQRDTCYISKGEIANIPPPSMSKMTIHDGRLFLLSSEDPNRIYYSKPKLRMSSLEFSDFHYIEASEKGGTALNIDSLSGKLFIFKKDLISVTYGTPMNASATAGGYAPVSSFSPSIGLTNAESLLSTDEGLFFQSYGDMYVIGKGLSVNKVGIEVGSSIAVVSSSISLSNVNELRICHSEGVVIYNTLFKQWYTSDFISRKNSVVIDGVQLSIDEESSVVVKEDANYFGDGTKPIQTDIETAWIKIAGPQGLQRVRNILFLGGLSSETTFNLELSYDYNEFPSEIIPITASSVATLEEYGAGTVCDPLTGEGCYGGTESSLYGGEDVDHIFQFRHKPKIQKCESMKIRIVETGLTSPTKGYFLNNMSLEIASKKSLFKLRESKTV